MTDRHLHAVPPLEVHVRRQPRFVDETTKAPASDEPDVELVPDDDPGALSSV